MGMYSAMKYICVSSPRMNAEEAIIIFPQAMIHKEMARGFHEVHSAGFVSLFDDDGTPSVKCWGESESLKVKSRPEIDSKLALKYFRGNMQGFSY